ncbi:hypothetical protein NOS3756_15390 [Nostoc sp. NIES-3756]|uniref:hypothetical protein n=1 Tax=Nostoc sp. NIES-3756 TaxID=1751286 RepID=UPI00071F4C86|nr:hypothetical protein [Nostoc sp. NIES-3756]BAT52599.1 hypothetical protein NOS3756_15390 [Nostoc sp. NIES-3756]
MNDIVKIRDYIVSRLEDIECSGGGGINLDFPDYELNAYDYLEYAYPLCEEKSDSALISCVSHLKRAVDCQLDTFLYVIGLGQIFSKANLKFEKKLEAIALAGIFRSNVLITLNRKRNILEHKYSAPDVDDVLVYYELVWAFVEVLESHMMMLNSSGESYWDKHNEVGKLTDYLYAGLNSGILHFKVESEILTHEVKIKPSNESSVKKFLIGLNILFLLIRTDRMWTKDRVVERLRLLDIAG